MNGASAGLPSSALAFVAERGGNTDPFQDPVEFDAISPCDLVGLTSYDVAFCGRCISWNTRSLFPTVCFRYISLKFNDWKQTQLTIHSEVKTRIPIVRATRNIPLMP